MRLAVEGVAVSVPTAALRNRERRVIGVWGIKTPLSRSAYENRTERLLSVSKMTRLISSEYTPLANVYGIMFVETSKVG